MTTVTVYTRCLMSTALIDLKVPSLTSKRMYQGIYQWFARKYSAAYLNKFSWRYGLFELSIEERITPIRYANLAPD